MSRLELPTQRRFWKAGGRFPATLVAILCGLGCTPFSGRSAISTAFADEREDNFEAKIRPLLIAHCVDCHGPDDQGGDLRLDRKTHAQKGGASGPAFVAGNPESSRLIRAIGYQDNALQMPPDSKLSEEQITLLTEWVKAGAYWPEDSEDASEADVGMSIDEFVDSQRKSHWSYQPISSDEPPALKDLPPAVVQSMKTADGTELTEIDRFVLQRLADASLQPNELADRRALIHRAHFTLTGLPPTYEEVQAFVADESGDAFARLVDRLLESQHYGERWARHWLDLARYGDTKGYLAGSRETRYPFAFTYRDYVIDAFNQDKPFDQFIVEQLAADQLDLRDGDRKNLAAMGLLTVGRKFMNRRADIIDDQIDVVTRGFLGITVACARCHDHKYDAVPTADYYSLYGVFDSSREPDVFPLLGEPAPSPEYDAFVAAKAAKQQEVDKWLDERKVDTEKELRSRVGDYLVMLPEALDKLQRGKLKFQGERGPLRRAAALRWYQYLADPAQSSQPIWMLWRHLAAIPKEDFAKSVPDLLAKLKETPTDADNATSIDAAPIDTALLDQRLIDQLIAANPQSMTDAAKVFGQRLESVHKAWTEAKKADASIEQLTDAEDETLRKLLHTPSSPTSLNREQMIAHLDQGQRNRYNQLLNQVNGIEVTHPGAPPRGMVLVDKPRPVEPVIFRRGIPSNRGDRVPRRFLQVLAKVDGGSPFQDGSGRLELARAIASPENPLTARVIVNRVWQHHFGEGLVRTPSDFGIRGEPPTHPQLLDYLAAQFIADGWSVKRLQRRIMMSATWQQSSRIRSQAMTADPENRLLWHMPRRRLEFEPLRDRLLVASGRLDDRIGGRSVKVHEDATRRALYAYIDREDLPNLLASFDLPSPDASRAKRTQTTVPQQALYLMNSPFVIKQATALAQRSKAPSQHPDASAQDSDAPAQDSDASVGTANQAEFHESSVDETVERIRRLYRLALTRDPDSNELKIAREFVNPVSVANFRDSLKMTESEKPRWQFGYGYWNDQTESVEFTRLPFYSGTAWQGSKEFPDSTLKYLRLTADGGHAGVSNEQSAIRRWISPVDGVVTIRGRLKHRGKQGDGVSAEIAHSRLGRLGSWSAFGSENDTPVQRIEVRSGDALDFIVGCVGGHGFDSFTWAPTLELSELSSDPPDKRWQVGSRWDATEGFAKASDRTVRGNGPKPLDPWTQLAQVLLLSNEFAFVD